MNWKAFSSIFNWKKMSTMIILIDKNYFEIVSNSIAIAKKFHLNYNFFRKDND